MPETRTDAAKPRGGDPVKELSDVAKTTFANFDMTGCLEKLEEVLVN